MTESFKIWDRAALYASLPYWFSMPAALTRRSRTDLRATVRVGVSLSVLAPGRPYAHGIHASQHRESVLIRSAAEAKIREADRLHVRRLERDYVGRCPGDALAWRPTG
ncbi:hypothetical protein SAMN05443247_07201 [Bradyrhizobium erythrophlei]|nr:hypothetical protein SAMN05443247_07201 [Bradyrhizobium erythrophlei]